MDNEAETLEHIVFVDHISEVKVRKMPTTKTTFIELKMDSGEKIWCEGNSFEELLMKNAIENG